MSVQESITRNLNHALSPSHLEVVNESGQHQVPPGSESHFKVTVVSPALAGLSRVARHRAVHQALADELAAGLHALAVHAFTPEEWEARGRRAEASPRCRGGTRSPVAHD
jgi:BolA protein